MVQRLVIGTFRRQYVYRHGGWWQDLTLVSAQITGWSMQTLAADSSIGLDASDPEESLNRWFHYREISPRMINYVGFACNERCRFCYYLESIESGTTENRTTEENKKQIREGRVRFGKTQIEFTGGEATIRPDFPQLVAYAKELGYEEISLITNGLKMSYPDYCKKIVDAGVNDVLFSFHSFNPEKHDWLTQIPGSHRRLKQAVENMIALGVKVRFNSVITSENYKDLIPHLEFLCAFNPWSINLIMFNPSEETADYNSHDAIRFTSYDEIASYVSEAITKFRDRVTALNVRFMPFCFLKGHEAHIRNYWQAIYEAKEWDSLLHIGYRIGWPKTIAAAIAGLALLPFSVARYGRKSLGTFLSELVETTRVWYLFSHVKGCRKCALRMICPGFHKDFLKTYGKDQKVHPYTDIPLVRNPVFFAFPRYAFKFPALMREKLRLQKLSQR
jgi:MoaA/NifB/PqqE/SkfB family radical SAM enzyme